MWQVDGGGGVSIDISRWQTNPRSSRIYDLLWLYRRLCQGNPRTAIEKRLKEAATTTNSHNNKSHKNSNNNKRNIVELSQLERESEGE